MRKFLSAGLALAVFLAFAPFSIAAVNTIDLIGITPHPTGTITVPADSSAVVVPATESGAVVVAPDNSVTIPYGQYVAGLGDIAKSWLQPLLLAALTSVITFAVPGPLGAIASSYLRSNGEQIISKGIDYGINAAKGATKDGTLTIPVGNKVLAHAVNYIVENGAPKLIEWLGGPDGVAQKVFARLNVAKDTGIDDFNVKPATGTPTPKGKATVTNYPLTRG